MSIEEEEVPAQQPAEPQQQPEPADRPLTVDISDVDDDDKPEPQQQASPEGPRRHKSDWRRMKEKYEQDLAEVRRELAEVRGRVSAPQQQHTQSPPTASAADPVEAEISGLAWQQDLVLRAINAGNLADTEQARAIEEWRRLDRKRRALEYQKDVGGKQPQGPQVQTEDQMIGQLLRVEFPQVFEDDELRTRAEAEMLALMKRGRAKSLATAREACQRAARRAGVGLFGGRPPEPTEAERSRYSSVSSRAGANGASGSQFMPNKMQLDLARSYTSHLPDLSDAERVKRWVRDVAKPAGLI